MVSGLRILFPGYIHPVQKIFLKHNRSTKDNTLCMKFVSNIDVNGQELIRPIMDFNISCSTVNCNTYISDYTKTTSQENIVPYM